jgi:hypothetical protein
MDRRTEEQPQDRRERAWIAGGTPPLIILARNAARVIAAPGTSGLR